LIPRLPKEAKDVKHTEKPPSEGGGDSRPTEPEIVIAPSAVAVQLPSEQPFNVSRSRHGRVAGSFEPKMAENSQYLEGCSTCRDGAASRFWTFIV
jgi:hypothetical protein